MITLEEFNKIDLKIGTIIEVELNKKARKPAYKLKIDLGDNLGIKKSSAQITALYTPNDLLGKQVVVVTNFPPLRVAGVKSEVRILGVESKDGVVLLAPERKVKNGDFID